jgi:hypothetical protein
MDMISAAPEALKDEDLLVQRLLMTGNNPLQFVTLAFPTIRLEKWQRTVLETIGKKLLDNAMNDRWKAVQIAVASGNGVGKTMLLSCLLLWGLMTFENTLGVCTAGTEPQIRTRLWGELSKWYQQLPETLRSAYELTATAIFNKQAERTHRIDGRPWSERNTEAFSGLHNYGARVLVVFDECSMIPESIWRATDGFLNDANTQTIFVVFGNPIRIDGRFPTLFSRGNRRSAWTSFNVDSREVSLTDKEAIAEKLAFYGETSNYARSHVYGQFPTSSAQGLIQADMVEAAATREASWDPADATIMGIDVATGHGESSSTIVIRRGLNARVCDIQRFANLDPMKFVYKVTAAAAEYNPDAIFVDATGVGDGVAARLRELGLPSHPVYLGSKSDYRGTARVANKRMEIWWAMREWLKVGAIPRDALLMAELTGPEVSETAQGLILERKKDMAARGLASPDSADSLALTFSSPVWTAAMSGLAGPGDHNVVSEYSPFSDEALTGKALPESRRRFYQPGWAKLRPEYGGDPVDALGGDPQGLWNEPSE